MNKNMDALCPVEGCRRLLAPGCALGTCSRCCLKGQGLLDASTTTTPVSTACLSESLSKKTAQVSPGAVVAPGSIPVDTTAGEQQRQTSEAAGTTGCTVAATEVAPATIESEKTERQRSFKARAEAEAWRALENHLLEHFREDLSAPFEAQALAKVLQQQQQQSVSFRGEASRDPATGHVKPGGDRSGIYRLPPSASGLPRTAAAVAAAEGRPPTRWCPAHKKSHNHHRRREQRGDAGSGGGVGPEAAELAPGNGEIGRAWSMAPTVVLTSAARVLLVREWVFSLDAGTLWTSGLESSERCSSWKRL